MGSKARKVRLWELSSLTDRLDEVGAMGITWTVLAAGEFERLNREQRFIQELTEELGLLSWRLTLREACPFCDSADSPTARQRPPALDGSQGRGQVHGRDVAADLSLARLRRS